MRKVSPLYFEEKNTILDGGSTELKAAYTVDTVDMVYNVDMVYTVDLAHTIDIVYSKLHCVYYSKCVTLLKH